MTPEEKAVIEAAIGAWHRNAVAGHAELRLAVQGLFYSCPQCNAGGHTCPGDGRSIGHTATDCGRHEPTGVDPGVVERLSALPDFSGTLKGVWVDPWAADFRPANPADALKVTAGTYPCLDCITDPDEDPIAWCDCEKEDRCSFPCRQRAHPMGRCPNRPCACSRTEKVYCHASECHGGADVSDDPVWIASTLLYCLAGDHIRIGTDETDVLRSSSGAWPANVISSVMPSGKTWDKVTPWEHVELRLDLSANPGFQQYPPDLACEILMGPERLAVHTLMTRFPGSTITEES